MERMANNLGQYAENHLLDHVLGTTAFTKPTAVYVALFTADPGNTGYANEVTTSAFPSYVRKACTFNASANGSTTSITDLLWTYDGSSALTIGAVAIYDSATIGAGNMLWHGTLTASKQVNNGDKFELPSGNITVSLD